MPWKGIFGIFSSAQGLRDLWILAPTSHKLDYARVGFISQIEKEEMN